MHPDQAEGVELNRANWDERVPLHLDSIMYGEFFEQLERGEHCLHQLTVDELGDVQGARTLHLQCHIGTDTLSLARLGADVVGYDFSAPAIEAAKGLSERFGIAASFVQGEIAEASQVLGEAAFDLVFTSDGVLCWLPDLQLWAQQIARLLKPGGRVYISDHHPIANAIGDDWKPSDQARNLVPFDYPYFFEERGICFNETGTYAGNDAATKNNKNIEWHHPVNQIVNALIDAGLRIERLFEHHTCFYQRFDCMSRRADGVWELPEPLRSSIPLRFSVRATKV